VRAARRSDQNGGTKWDKSALQNNGENPDTGFKHELPLLLVLLPQLLLLRNVPSQEREVQQDVSALLCYQSRAPYENLMGEVPNPSGYANKISSRFQSIMTVQ